jgi:hypothetical protein
MTRSLLWTLLVTLYGVVSHKASHALRPFSDLLCVPIWILIIPDLSTRGLCQVLSETPSSEASSWRENSSLAEVVSVILRRDLQHAVKHYDMRSKAILLLWRKACCGFLSSLKILRRRLGLNTLSLVLMASTLAITQPRTTSGTIIV